MPGRKQVPSLLDHCMAAIRDLVSLEALRVARVVVTKFIFDEIEAAENLEESSTLGEAWERENYLKYQILSFKEHLLSHIPPHLQLLEKVLDEGVLKGIQKAIKIKNLEWTPTTNATRYTREMYAIIAFSEILILTERRFLDLNAIPKMIRSCLYGRLNGFSGLRTLILGCGSGGWVTEAYSDSFLLGIPNLKNLVHFSLKYDCTQAILECLTQTCNKSIRILDMEHSQQVNDDCLALILSFKGVNTINVHQTDLSLEAQIRVVLDLPDLAHLENGDFLCDVLDYCADHNLLSTPSSIKLEEFYSSEEYYFHSEDQMKRIATFCPKIRKMIFMFEKVSCPTKGLSVLSDFLSLQELELWGGEFYSDGLFELLQNIGHQLTALVLVHVEEFDERAFAIITACCQNLIKLSLTNCDFVENLQHLEDIELLDNNINNQDRSGQDRQELLRIQQEARDIRSIMMPLLDLEALKIISSCDGKYLSFIIGNCINLKDLSLGMNNKISDEVIIKILSTNRLSRLERLYILNSNLVSMHGIELIMESCERLKILKDLEWFSKISKKEFEDFGTMVRNENLDLIIHNEKSSIQEWQEIDQIRKQKVLDLVGGKKVPDFDNSIEWNTG